MEEVAKLWKAESGGVIVEDGTKLKGILKTVSYTHLTLPTNREV